MGYKLKRSVVIMLAFIMTVMMSAAMFTAFATDMSNYTFAAKVVDEEGSGVNGVVVKIYTDDKKPVTYTNWAMGGTVPLSITSENGEATLSLQRIDSGFENKNLNFVVEDENYESENVHTIQINSSANLTSVNGVAFDWENPPQISFVVKGKTAEPVEYVVTYNTNGGESLDPASATTENGKLASLPTPTHANENMVFNGWFTEATGGSAVTTDTEYSENTTIYAQWVDTSAPWNEDDFTYSDDNTTLTGLSNSGKAKLKVNSELVLPDSHKGVDIIAVGPGVNGSNTIPATSDKQIGTFGYIEDGVPYIAEKIVFPAKLEKIGQWAFSAATSAKANGGQQFGLKEVSLPETLKTIENFAFSGNPLTSVVIPDGVETMGSGIFSGFDGAQTKIKSVAFPERPKFNTVPNGIFSTQSIDSVDIPEGIEKVDRNAFTGNEIKTLRLPNSLTEIGQGAFENHQLQELSIPEHVTSIGNAAFRVTTGSGQSREKTLKTLTISKESKLVTIGTNAFLGSKLEAVDIPETVTSLGRNSFAQNESGVDDGKVLIKVATEEQFNGTTKFIANGDGHKVSVNITFDSNGGAEVDPATVQTGLGLKLASLPEATKEGDAVFVGWFTDSENGDEVTLDTEYTKNTTLYAHWSNKQDVDAAEKAKTEADAAKDAAEKAATEAANAKAGTKDAVNKATAAKAAADAALAKAEAAKAAAEKAYGAGSEKAKAAAKAVEEAKAAADKAAAAKDAADKAAADQKAQSVKTVTVNAKTVNAAAIDKAVKAAGGSKEYVTKIVLGKKVKKIKSKAFKNYRKVTVLEVKTKKLTKRSVKGSLKGSSISKVKVKIAKAKINKKYVKKYKKFFTKKNAGKKAKVTR